MLKKKEAKNIQLLEVANKKNEKIIKEFEKLIDQIKFDMDNAPIKEARVHGFRLKQVSKVLEILKNYPKEITSGEQLKGIKDVGAHSITRINEILKTGRLSEIKIKGKHKQYLDYIEELEQIIGIGRKTAYELITKHHITSIDELRKAYLKGKVELNNQIKLGLKYHGVYQQSIPRQEVDKIYNYLGNEALDIDTELLAVICGSYRRLKPKSNDVDVLLAHPKIVTKGDIKSNQNYLFKFIERLKKNKFLLDDLTDKDFEVKYMGFCQFEENNIKFPIRRIDIRYIPYESYYTALLYFTGSGEFNRKMRELAIELGYELSEYALKKVVGNKKIKVKINSEKDVFDKLGMEYLSPEKRN
jgi:DNA polymerase beta